MLPPMYPAATMKSTPNSSKGKKKPHISGKSKEQFDISSKMLKVPEQSATLLGREYGAEANPTRATNANISIN